MYSSIIFHHHSSSKHHIVDFSFHTSLTISSSSTLPPSRPPNKRTRASTPAMTMTMLMLPLNHQLQIITLVMMFLLVTIFNDVLLDVFDGVLLIVGVGWSTCFAQLTGVCPEDVLLVFGNPAFDEEEFGVLVGGGS